jgi:peptidoglycan/LPS O-acetylase OafA/YrhL
VHLGHFYLRRALRILPPFYLVLAAATSLTLVGFLEGDLTGTSVAYQAGHLSNVSYILAGVGEGAAPGTDVLWSLAVEEHFYLLFPWLFLALIALGLSGRPAAAVLVGVCGLALIWRIVLVADDADVFRTYIATDTRFDSILWGCALALGFNPAADLTGAGERQRRLWVRRLLPAGLALLASTFIIRTPEFRETLRYTLQGVGLVPVFVVGVRWPHTFGFRVLNHRAVAFVGVLSYSLYLVHNVVMHGTHQHLPRLPRPLQALVALGLSLCISYAIYLAVERPCATLRKRLSHRSRGLRRPEPEPVLAGAAST